MSIFADQRYSDIENKITELLNKEKTFLSKSTVKSTRAVGDAIETIISDNFEEIVSSYCKRYSSDFARRAMADLAFEDKNGIYYMIDVKTHNAETKFNMPNLTSVRRLAKLYHNEDYIEKDYFTLLIVRYEIKSLDIKVLEVNLLPIENLDWSCLTIGALGWGQIQIANSNNIQINRELKRKRWMIQLCDELAMFYPREVAKIEERKIFFAQTKPFWEKWPDR